MRISALVVSAGLLAACSPGGPPQPATPPPRQVDPGPAEVDAVLLQPVALDTQLSEAPVPAPPASHCPGECEALATAAREELERAVAAPPERQVAEAARAAEALESAWGTCAGHEQAKDRCDLPALVRDMAEANRIAGRTFDQGAALLVMNDSRYGLNTSAGAQEARRTLLAMAERAEQDAAGGKLDEPSLALAALVRLAFEAPLKARADAMKLAPRHEHTAPVVIAVARDEAKRGQWASVSALVGALQLGPDRPELFLEREALLGEAMTRRGQEAAAQPHFRRIVAAWEAEPEDSRREMLAQVRPHPLLDRDDLTDALGAAYYYRAEEKRRALEQDKLPRLRGTPSSSAVSAYAKDVFAPWMRRQQEAMQEANAAYLRVIEITPPPYRWVVASGERVGHMTYAFVEEMRAIPAPNEIKKDPELLAAYEAALESASEPMVERAKAAYRTCAGTAELHGDPDGKGAKCKEWLNAHP